MASLGWLRAPYESLLDSGTREGITEHPRTGHLAEARGAGQLAATVHDTPWNLPSLGPGPWVGGCACPAGLLVCPACVESVSSNKELNSGWRTPGLSWGGRAGVGSVGGRRLACPGVPLWLPFCGELEGSQGGSQCLSHPPSWIRSVAPLEALASLPPQATVHQQREVKGSVAEGGRWHRPTGTPSLLRVSS